MKDKILKNKKVIIPIVSILLILVIVGVSFAYYSATVNKVSNDIRKIPNNIHNQSDCISPIKNWISIIKFPIEPNSEIKNF